MLRELALVMPMAGQGSRFREVGIEIPKPLVELWGRPLFWWSTESVRRSVSVHELVFVVLAEHVERFAIHATIRRFYPRARIVALPAVTSGAAESAARGVASLRTNGPFAVNDCDHAFRADALQGIVGQLDGRVEGALLGFRSQSPAYSYVRFDGHGNVIGTVEKQVVSEHAIAGCYLFSDPRTFLDHVAEYRKQRTYDELFLSGVYNVILRGGGDVVFHEIAEHVSFGTPDECRAVAREDLTFLETKAT